MSHSPCWTASRPLIVRPRLRADVKAEATDRSIGWRTTQDAKAAFGVQRRTVTDLVRLPHQEHDAPEIMRLRPATTSPGRDGMTPETRHSARTTAHFILLSVHPTSPSPRKATAPWPTTPTLP